MIHKYISIYEELLCPPKQPKLNNWYMWRLLANLSQGADPFYGQSLQMAV